MVVYQRVMGENDDEPLGFFVTENYGWHCGKHQNRPEIRCQNQNPLRSPGKEKSESEI